MMRRAISSWLFVATALSFVLTLQVAAQESKPKKRDFRPRRLLPEQPPIVRFEVKNADQVANTLDEAELVLGVAIGDEARAYPINMLTGPRREIINDRVGDVDIAATW